jgi:site-specific recombinase XerD
MNYIAHLKRFYRWMIEQGHPIDLVKLNRIKTPGIDRMTKTADDMLTEDEVQSIYMATGRVRDRALFSMMYEGGFRPVDLYDLQWGRVQFNDQNVVVTTNAKVDENPRRVPLFKCRGYLVQWRDDYPGKPEGDNYVFVSLRLPHEPIGYRGMQTAFHRAVRLSGIDKKKSMYFLRHSHVTHLQEQGVSDAVNKLTHWGSQSSNMLATYSHISNDHVDQVLAEHAGVTPQKRKKTSKLKAIQCPKCATVNPPEANRCFICGTPLSDDALTEDELLFKMLLDVAKRDPGKLIEALKKVS